MKVGESFNPEVISKRSIAQLRSLFPGLVVQSRQSFHVIGDDDMEQHRHLLYVQRLCPRSARCSDGCSHLAGPLCSGSRAGDGCATPTSSDQLHGMFYLLLVGITAPGH